MVQLCLNRSIAVGRRLGYLKLAAGVNCLAHSLVPLRTLPLCVTNFV